MKVKSVNVMKACIATLCVVALGWIVFLAYVVFAPQAEGHARYVYLHNHNDSAWVTTSHAKLVACDGTDNGKTFGVQGRTRSGTVRTLWDDGPGQSCNIYPGGGVGDFHQIRWIEDVGNRARAGEWRKT